MKDNVKAVAKKIIIILIWTGIWEIGSLLIGNVIFLPSPVQTVCALWNLFFDSDFISSILLSIKNIMLGFLYGVIIACFLGAASFKKGIFRDFIELPVKVIRATPVASFTILALLWVNSKNLSVLISALMSFPIIYTNIIAQTDAADSRLLEMANVFDIRKKDKIRYIYLPSVLPGLLSGCQTATGLAWKSGIAAEVIGIAKNTIGNNLYQAKIYLETENVFAWTLVIIILSIFFEKLVVWLIGLLKDRLLYENAEKQKNINLYRERFSSAEYVNYVNKVKDIIRSGKSVCIMGESGGGKTTLINKICQDPEFSSFSRVFQENRLCESTTAEKNLTMVLKENTLVKNRNDINEVLSAFGILQLKAKRVRELSGGEKRRISIARAAISDKQYYFFDEPFSGLDAETKKSVSEYLRKRLNGKTICLVSHSPEDASLLGIDECLELIMQDQESKNK